MRNEDRSVDVEEMIYQYGAVYRYTATAGGCGRGRGTEL